MPTQAYDLYVFFFAFARRHQFFSIPQELLTYDFFHILPTVAATLQAAATNQKLYFWPSNYSKYIDSIYFEITA